MAFVLRDFVVSLIRGNSSNTPNADLTSFVNVFTSLLSGAAPASGGGTSNFLRADGTWAAPGGGGGSGTVTSVALADGSSSPIYSISGSPVTTSGTLTETLVNQSANQVFAGPTSGGAAQPTFRALVAADVSGLVPAAANPSASVGLAAVNGSAATFLRSDGAPALSQAIAPTWTGTHTFNPGSGDAIKISSGDLNTGGGAGSSGQVLVSQGAGASPKWAGALGVTTNVQTFTQAGGASQTYTVPAGATWVRVIVIGGGGGGGSGAHTGVTSTTNAGGGGGGGGGGVSIMDFIASTLGSTASIVFSNVSGGGGAAGVASGTGGTGTAGSNATFNGNISAVGGGAGTGGSSAGGGASGAGGTGITFVGLGGGGGGSTAVGGAAVVESNTSGANNTCSPGGGGGGGAVNTTPIGSAGGAGGAQNGTNPPLMFTTQAGGTAGGGTGGGPANVSWLGIGAGGGGGATGTTNGGAGGPGGNYGGGGGGGGGCQTGAALSGAGGNGGPAAVICIAW